MHFQTADLGSHANRPGPTAAGPGRVRQLVNRRGRKSISDFCQTSEPCGPALTASTSVPAGGLPKADIAPM